MERLKKLIFLVALTLVSVASQAQISQEIINVLQKSQAAMENPAGVEMEMKVKTGMAVFSMTTYSKGDKSLARISLKILGREAKSELGCDGKQQWKYKPRIKAGDVDRRDTLYITPVNGKSKGGDYSIDFGLDKEYRKATMKEKDGRYEITFTEPRDSEMPKKTIMRINKSNYHFYEIESKGGGVSMRMTATKIKFGVSDDLFKLDQKKYPGAVVVRK